MWLVVTSLVTELLRRGTLEQKPFGITALPSEQDCSSAQVL